MAGGRWLVAALALLAGGWWLGSLAVCSRRHIIILFTHMGGVFWAGVSAGAAAVLATWLALQGASFSVLLNATTGATTAFSHPLAAASAGGDGASAGPAALISSSPPNSSPPPKAAAAVLPPPPAEWPVDDGHIDGNNLWPDDDGDGCCPLGYGCVEEGQQRPPHAGDAAGFGGGLVPPLGGADVDHLGGGGLVPEAEEEAERSRQQGHLRREAEVRASQCSVCCRRIGSRLPERRSCRPRRLGHRTLLGLGCRAAGLAWLGLAVLYTVV